MRTALRRLTIVSVLAIVATACGSESDLPSASTGDTISPSSEPATTVAPTEVASTAAVTTDSTEAPTTAATDAPTTTAASTTAPPTTIAAVPSRPIVAVDGNGDAVIVERDGTTVLLFDGTDPDDPPPSEGETTAVDGIAVTSDRVHAYIGDCCEPVPGTLLITTPPAVATYENFAVYGHAPHLNPDETLLVRDVYGDIVVSDLDLVDLASISLDVADVSIIGAVFVDADTIVALLVRASGASLAVYEFDGTTVLAAGATASVAPAPGLDAFQLSLAGAADGVLYLTGIAPSVMTAFDAATLAPLPDHDIALPDEPLSAWYDGEELRWVDQLRALHVGPTADAGVIVPGEFTWVR